MTTSSGRQRQVYLVDGLRTPFLKFKGRPGPMTASDLAVTVTRMLVHKQPFAVTEISEVITGCAMSRADEANIARIIALRTGLGMAMSAFTVQRNCASGLQALDSASLNIQQGVSQLVLAGGCEAMSYAPVLFSDQFVHVLANFYQAKSVPKKLLSLLQIRLKDLAPVYSVERGLTDHIVNLAMGQTAENLAKRFDISREEMDAFALRSHQRVLQAQSEKLFPEILPLYTASGQLIERDDGVRTETSMEKLSILKPQFDRPYGLVTAGNSSQITDGAAFVLLADGQTVKKYQLPILARVVDVSWAGVDPAQMGLGPAHAIAPMLQRHHLKLSDIDYWEINEAFAAQVIAVINALSSREYCAKEFGLHEAVGEIDQSRLNIDGGAVALGHPIGASGARIVLHLAHVLQRKQARYGIASLCIGGGQGGAMLLEQVSEVIE